MIGSVLPAEIAARRAEVKSYCLVIKKNLKFI
jgi:hypothetical protein